MNSAIAYTERMKKYFVILTTLLMCSFASAALNYAQLALMDLDQMNAMVKEKIATFKRDNSTQSLMEGVQAVYSRPDNGDGMVEKVIPPLRAELDENDQWEPVMDTLVQEAIDAHRSPKNSDPVRLNTYAIFLENVIADFKPFAEKPGHERKTIQKIADAKIELTKAQKDERWKRGVSSRVSPSEMAKKVIESAKKAEAENAKAQAAAAKAEADAKADAPTVETAKKKKK